MNSFIVLLKKIVALILSFFAAINVSPVTILPTEQLDPYIDKQTEYIFASEKEYKNYYLFAEDANDEAWSDEAIEARQNVAGEINIDGFNVTLFKNKTARINSIIRPMQDVVIPSNIEGYSVTVIRTIVSYATDSIWNSVKKVEIPDSVEYIMENAFTGLANLRSVTLGNRVKYIDVGAFRDCICLDSVILPDSLDSISSSVFRGCYKLSNVIIGKNVQSVGFAAFEDCLSLQKVIIPENVTTMKQECFCGCRSLKDIFIPKSVNTIEKNAFRGCSKLTIHGEKASFSETYAKENGFSFIAT